MEKNTAEERSVKRQLRRERKKERKRTWVLIVISVLVLLALGAVIYFITRGDSYNNAESFDKYAASYMQTMKEKDGEEQTEPAKAVMKYGSPYSTSIEYPVVKDKRLKSRMDSVVSDRVKKFKKDNKKVEKSDKLALFLRSENYDSPKHAAGLVIYENRQKEEGHNMSDVSSGVYTYNYAAATGVPLKTNQIFHTDYRTLCSEYAITYFENNNSEDLVKGSFHKTLSDSERNFNKYVLMEDGVRFFFEPGKVLKKELGPAFVDISYDNLKGAIRDELIVRYIDPNKPMVAITYDDGPYPASSNRILDCFEKYGEIATFFELGKNVRAHPEVVKRETELGMEVGSHSWSHPNLKTSSKKTVKFQLQQTSKEIKKACGVPPTVFRPPYGNTSKTVEKYANAPVILWSVDTLDWKSRDADSVERVVKGVKNLDGRVVLMHSIYDSTAEATEKLIPWLEKKGYQLVTVSELLEYRYKEAPKKGKFYGYGYFYPK